MLAEHTEVFERGDERWSFRYRIAAADGRIIWVRDDAIIVRDASGEPDYVQGFLIDITEEVERESERTAALEAQRDAEYRYRRLVENLPLAVYLDRPDETGTSEYISPSVERMLGYPVERWMDPAFFLSVVHPEDRERIEAETTQELRERGRNRVLRVPPDRRGRADRPRSGRPVDPEGRRRPARVAPGLHDGRDGGAPRPRRARRGTGAGGADRSVTTASSSRRSRSPCTGPAIDENNASEYMSERAVAMFGYPTEAWAGRRLLRERPPPGRPRLGDRRARAPAGRGRQRLGERVPRDHGRRAHGLGPGRAVDGEGRARVGRSTSRAA